MSVTRTCNEWPLQHETTHKTFATMKKNNQKAPVSGNYMAIDELIEQTSINRLSSKRIKQLRKQAQKEAEQLYKDQDWQIGKDMPYNDATIRLYVEKVVTWEKNYQIQDSLLDLYRSQQEHIDWLEKQLSNAKAKAKETSNDLERAYPNSESIKYELRFQIR